MSKRPRIAGERRVPVTAPSAGASSTSVADEAQAERPTDETTAPSTTDTDGHDSSARAERSRPPRTSTLSRRARIVLAVLGVVAVLAVAFAVIATVAVHQVESSAQKQSDAADAATAAATKALPKVLGYRYATVAKDLDAATSVMSPAFAKEYLSLKDQIVSGAQQRKIDVVASVRAISPLECGQECSTDDVRLLAFVDQDRTIAGKPGTPAALSAVVRMTKRDGTWVVAELTTV